MRKLVLFGISIITTLFFSCEKDPPVRVIPEPVAKQVDAFLSEAAKRGIDLDEKNIFIVLTDSSKMAVERPGYYDPNSGKIFIDTGCVEFMQCRDELLFHELGHGVLKRSHRNDLLPDKSPASIMNGDVLLNFSECPEKKTYYVSELFLPTLRYKEALNQRQD